MDERALLLYFYLVVLYTLNMVGFLITNPLMIFAQTKRAPHRPRPRHLPWLLRPVPA